MEVICAWQKRKEKTRRLCSKYAYDGATLSIDEKDVPREEKQDFDRCPS